MITRGFVKINENTIMFDNGSQVSFTGKGDTSIDGNPVTVKEFMDHLFSDEYLINLAKNSEEHAAHLKKASQDFIDSVVKNGKAR